MLTLTQTKTPNKPSTGRDLQHKTAQPQFTILVTTDPDWYHNLHPHEGPFLDSHVITHFKADTITYDEPTIQPVLRIEPRIESRDIHVLCIHHKTSPLTRANMHVACTPSAPSYKYLPYSPQLSRPHHYIP